MKAIITVLALLIVAGNGVITAEIFDTATNDTSFFDKVKTLAVVDIQAGCGRMKNRLLIFSDGSKACCKYSETVKEQEGELYAYHLSKLLLVSNVPPVVLVTLNFSGTQWRKVSDIARSAGWRNGKTVLLTSFVENLKDEYFPIDIMSSISGASSDDQTIHDLAANDYRMWQWSDMIVLDYITGHTDRLFCTLVNMQWASSVVNKPIHNLGITTSGRLVLFDNESCFIIGYRAGNSYSNKLQTHFVDHLCSYHSTIIDILQQHVAGSRDLLLEARNSIIKHQSSTKHSPHTLSQRNQDEFMKRNKYVLNQFHKCSQQ